MIRRTSSRMACIALTFACGDATGAADTGSTVPDATTSAPEPTSTSSTTSSESSSGATRGPNDTTTFDMETTTGLATTGTDTTGTTGTTGAGCLLGCSDDLQSVECDGLAQEVCAAGSLCVDGACVVVTPCEAAALRQQSEGCEFYAVKTEVLKDATGSCFAAFVANTGDAPTRLTVEYGGQSLPVGEFTRIPSGQGKDIVYQPYDPAVGVPPGEVAILFLSRGPGDLPDCPAPAAIAEEIQVVGTGRGDAFHITSDLPIAAYQMLPYGGGAVALTAATLLLPTGAWGTNYIAVNPYAQSDVPGTYPLLAVVATEDDTVITLDPAVAVIAGDQVDGGPAGVPIMYTLGRGETLQMASPRS